MRRDLIGAVAALGLIGGGVYANETAPEYKASSMVKVLVGGGHGSGVHIGDGLVLTAAHVVAGVKDAAEVKVRDEGGAIHEAEILWQAKANDVALIRIKGHKDIAASELSCEVPKVGMDIHGYGNPLHQENWNVYGKVAGTPRKVGPWAEIIPLNMAILQGQSGGPVFNDAGKVVGLMVGYMNGQQGDWTSFSVMVPSSVVCTLMARA